MSKEKQNVTAVSNVQKFSSDSSSYVDYKVGLSMVGKQDCITCHKISERLIGPSFQEVSIRYEKTDNNVKMLAEKVIKGGSGSWGKIPMTPHTNLSKPDAEKIVKFILELKNQ